MARHQSEFSMTEVDDSLAGGRTVGLGAGQEDLYSFRSDDSFEPIAEGPAPMKDRPNCVPALDLSTLEEYQSVDDSQLAEEEEKGAQE